MPDPGDEEVFRRSREEPEMFHAVVDRHFDSVHRYLQRRVGRELADELAAQVFLVAFEQRSACRMSGGSARSWLLGIASILTRRQWRSERRSLRAYARTGVDPNATDDVDALAARVDSRRRGQELAAALAVLPRRQREALLLYALGDLSYGEVAIALDVPVGTVKTLLHRARLTARRHLSSRVPPTARTEGGDPHG